MQLQGRSALVTGGAKRLGRALCLALARRGVHVAIHYRNSESEARQLQSEIESLGVQATTVCADLSRRSATSFCPEAMFDSACAELGPISILINNASHFEANDVKSASTEDWQRDLDLHVVQPAALCAEFQKRLGNDSEGRIVNLLDWRAQLPDTPYLTYNVAKGGLWSLTRNLAFQLGPRITVNAIAPGPILPPAAEPAEREPTSPAGSPAAVPPTIDASRLPLQRWGNPESVVKAALFLLEDADYTTGAVIPVDGGRHLGERC